MENLSISEYRDLANKEKKHNKQPEGDIQRCFGRILNGVLKPRLNPDLIYWTYSGAGERKSIKTAALQKKKGLQPGDSDYRFEIIKHPFPIYYSGTNYSRSYQHTVYLEFKSQVGTLTKAQKIFKEKHEGLSNVSLYYPRSVQEGIEALEREMILLSK